MHLTKLHSPLRKSLQKSVSKVARFDNIAGEIVSPSASARLSEGSAVLDGPIDSDEPMNPNTVRSRA